jgi:hypothetical protein
VDLAHHAVEPDDLSIHEDNGHLRPRFVMNQRSPATGAARDDVGCAFDYHGQL